uniref:RNase H type-1 domain-containing protein n=1 Tax=Cannabis sativa TaxID=3483 RepID=A0A803QQV0_CANSA
MKSGIMRELGLNNAMGNINYLGLLLFRYPQKDADFNSILDNLTAKLSKKLPSKIDSMVRDFWWGCEQGNHAYESCLFSSSEAVLTPVWSLLPLDWVKINCDLKVGGDTMCTVALARDHNEAVLWVATNKLNFSNPLIGEAASCLLAVETTVFLHHPFVLVESDFKTVINTLKGILFQLGD